MAFVSVHQVNGRLPIDLDEGRAAAASLKRSAAVCVPWHRPSLEANIQTREVPRRAGVGRTKHRPRVRVRPLQHARWRRALLAASKLDAQEIAHGAGCCQCLSRLSR